MTLRRNGVTKSDKYKPKWIKISNLFLYVGTTEIQVGDGIGKWFGWENCHSDKGQGSIWFTRGKQEMWNLYLSVHNHQRLVSGELEIQLFRSGCMCAFPNSLRNYQLLAAYSRCCTTRCIGSIQLCYEPEQIKMKNAIFLLLEPIQVKYYHVMCPCRVEEAAVEVAWGEERLGDGTGPEWWCSEAAYGSLSNNHCLCRTLPLTDSVWMFSMYKWFLPNRS